MKLIESVGKEILGELAGTIPASKKYISRKEKRGYTLFFNDSLKYFYFDNVSFKFLNEFDGKKNIQQIAKNISKKSKLPFLVICNLLVRYLNSFNSLEILQSENYKGEKKIKIKKPKDFIPTAPNQIAVLLTNECNLRCSHCGNENRDRKENELSRKEWFGIIDECAKLGVFIFNVSGGEPFVRKDWYEILSYARSKNIEVAITSNGTLIDEEIVQKLKKLETFNIHLSLDGVGEVHDYFRNKKGVFGTVVNAINLLKKHEIPFGITTSVSKRNFGKLDELAEFIRENGIYSWEIYWAIPLGCMNRQEVLSQREILDFAKKIYGFRNKLKDIKIFVGDNLGYFDKYNMQEDWNGCRAGITICAIDSEGNVKGCPIHPNFLVEGNLRKGTLRDIWRDKKSFGYNRNSKPKLTKHCKECRFSKVCRGGCKASMYAQHKSFECNDYCLKFIEKNVRS
jgi:radical SAM protein with 4Fe4S-binding SPASM domain